MKGVSEPYRMPTARRIVPLGADNAISGSPPVSPWLPGGAGTAIRLEGSGAFSACALLEGQPDSNEAARHGLKSIATAFAAPLSIFCLAGGLYSKPAGDLAELGEIATKTAAQIEIDAKYAVYLTARKRHRSSAATRRW